MRSKKRPPVYHRRRGRHALAQAVVRLEEGYPLFSEKEINTQEDAVQLMAAELATLDREEMIVINVDRLNRPINYNIVGLGTDRRTYFSISNIFKSAILSNADHVIAMHCHPFGDTFPSAKDIEVTNHMVMVGRFLELDLYDHIIVGCGTGECRSMRNHKDVSFF